MREIRFRAWDKEKKRMIANVVSVFHFDQGEFHGIGYRGGCTPRYYQKNHVELMQYTGLLDKNGKEIYEGDILRGNQGNFKVLWESGRYTVAFPKGATVQNLHTFLLSNGEKEVIGNIYENPERLK